MPIAVAYKTISIKPVTGPLDMRSQPDEVPFGGFRRRINWEITDSGKPGRVRGFQKLLADASPYNNQDLHDQLLTLQQYYDDLATPDSRGPSVTAYPPPADICGTTLNVRTTERQPQTMLAELVSADGQRKMMAATQNRISVLEESQGNWKIISDGYGGIPQSGLPERRWKQPAQVGNISILTNGYDPLMYYQFDGITAGCAMQAIQPIPDAAVIGLTRAGCVYAWRGVVFLGDVTMNGVRYEDMVYWGDKDAPLSLDPAAEGTVADFQRLDYGERVMGFVALHNYLLIVTTRSIWQITVSTDTSSNDAPVFSFQQLYSEPEKGQACIVYPNTLASDGDSIYYLGKDGLYRFNLYLSVPEKTPWIHAATSLIFEGIEGIVEPINESVCEGHIAWYDPRSQSIGVSWVETGQTFPRRTLTFQIPDKFAAELDFGVTAACNFTSSPSIAFMDWLMTMCACTAAELATPEILELLPAPIKTGGYCVEPTDPACVPPLATNAPIYTNHIRRVANNITPEDYEWPEADEGSWCKQFGQLSINDLCNFCRNQQLFVFAHATDWCLKQMGPEIYVREINTSNLPCGTWEDEGYEDKLIIGPIFLDLPDEEKNIRKLELEFSAVEQSVPAEMNVRIGCSANAFDPNLTSTATCGVVWKTLTPKDLVCPTPNKPLTWTFWFTGRMLYIELSTSGIGGGYNLSRIGMEIRALPRSTTS